MFISSGCYGNKKLVYFDGVKFRLFEVMVICFVLKKIKYVMMENFYVMIYVINCVIEKKILNFFSYVMCYIYGFILYICMYIYK